MTDVYVGKTLLEGTLEEKGPGPPEVTWLVGGCCFCVVAGAFVKGKLEETEPVPLEVTWFVGSCCFCVVAGAFVTEGEVDC